ncbi:ATP-binding protein [Jeotgalibacillus soli]|uniref:histidine kinase n=1 Tax=Jeotgalibacillus soli TaxID=889306 RepID=A0A0C2W5W4_9BACL|nr:ATP-binding protein [Jeotgalibacillus soli]KIL51966.1 histidine kinase [Jeotgalibacillus soli]
MDLITKDLLINFLLILLPLFLLQTFYQLKYSFRSKEIKKWMFAVIPILSLILCMQFPVALGENFVWDLRRIPFILGALYGGYRLGLFLLALMFITRFLMGGDGFYVSIVSYSLIMILIFFVSKYYLKMALKYKLLVSCLIIFLSLMISLFLSEAIFSLNMGTSLWIQFIVINLTGMLIITILWEVIRTNFQVLQELIKAEKMDIVSHLAASISHEVRNPLTVSKGFMQMSVDEEISAETRRIYVDFAVQEMDRASEIIDDYLTFAKPSIEQNDKMSVCEELQHAVNVIKPLANMNEVEISLPVIKQEKYFVSGERKKFQQCLINILKNGIESMPEGGSLQIGLSSNHQEITLTIRDEGKGMTQEQMNRLGEPYFTTKEKGTGLGMMVSYSIISGMNGQITVDSEVGKGTCFTIKLPPLKEMIPSETILT